MEAGNGGMQPRPSDVYDVLETAGFAALATTASHAVHVVELLKRAQTCARALGWTDDDPRTARMEAILERFEQDIAPSLKELCADADVATLFDHGSRIWERAPLIPA